MRKGRYVDHPIGSWEEFLEWYSRFRKVDDKPRKRWIFRGEGAVHEALKTSIEREAEAASIPLGRLQKLEVQLLNEFRRRFHHYSTRDPERGDLAEWLSLMRHYGAPTRLLDWSYSPFVALHFAIERAHEGQCVIWYMDSTPYTGPKVLDRLEKDVVRANFKTSSAETGFKPERTKRPQAEVIQYFFDTPTPGIVLVNPFRLSERTTVQQAVHLMPGDVTSPFADNLDATYGMRDGLTRLKIAITSRLRKDFLTHLHRMNIDRATLFPGLQGFAESLQTRMSIPEALSR